MGFFDFLKRHKRPPAEYQSPPDADPLPDEDWKPKAPALEAFTRAEYDKHMNMEASLAMGDDLGYDAVEISAHLMSAPDHEPIQGRVFLKDQFNRMQAGLDFVDIDGFYYEGIPRPICGPDCMHFPSAFSTEYSIRRYSDETLDEYAVRNAKGCIFEGKHYTTYQAGQLMKSVAREIRSWKDLANGVREAGDMEKRRDCQREIDRLAVRYYQIAEAAHLRPDPQTMSIPGFRRVNVDPAYLQDEADFAWLQSNLPALCPKSLTGYRRMKNQNTKNYQKIVAAARGMGYEIK